MRDILLYFSSLITFHISFVSVRSLRAGGQTGDVEPTFAQYWVTVSCLTPRRMWASITDSGPILTQLLFKASCWYYSQHEVGLLTTVEWILASTGDAGPTFNRHWVSVGLHCHTRSPANTRIEPVLVLCRASVADGGPELEQHWVKVSKHRAGITASMTTVEWISASTGDADPTFNRHWLGVGLHCHTRSPAKHEDLN